MTAMTVTAVRATACGHVLASASQPLLIERVTAVFASIAATGDTRFELVQTTIAEARKDFADGLNCTRCMIEVSHVR